MKWRPPRSLGLAADRHGCLFQSFVMGQMLFGIAAIAGPHLLLPYMVYAAFGCMVGWAAMMWIGTR